MSKGSKRRPMRVNPSKFEEQWDSIFGKGEYKKRPPKRPKNKKG